METNWSVPYYQRNKTLEDRFWEKADIKGKQDCWNWKASKNKKGYGNFYTSTGNSKDLHHLAHRMAWELYHGMEVPIDMLVCHKCDNPSCVNPKHLFLGTNQDNMDDKVQKGRAVGLKGSKQTQAKLTEIKVQEIKELRKSGKTFQSIALIYGVHLSLIHRICNGKKWSHTSE